MHISNLLALVLAVGAADVKPPAAPSKPQAQPAGSVTLRFGWRDGLTAKLRLKTVHSIGESPLGESMTTGALHVLRKDDELRIVNSNRKVAGEGLGAGMSKDQPMPIQVVSTQGEHLRLDGVDHAVNAAYDTSALGALGLKLGPSVIASMKGTWNDQIGLWRGRELTFGQPVELLAKAASGVTGTDLNTRYTLTAVGRVPCRTGEKQPRCVKLLMRSAVAPSELPAVSKAMMEPFAALTAANPQLAIKMETLRVEQEGELVTEPDTLIPHRFTLKETTEIESSVPGREKQSILDIWTMDYLYEYPAH